MISSKLCFAATAVIRDNQTNRISAFNILEGLIPLGLPLFLPELSCVTLWEREVGDAQVIRGTFTVNLDNDNLTTTQMHVDFSEVMRSRSIVNISGLVIPRSGVLRFRFVLETGATAEYSAEIEAPPPAVAQEAQPVRVPE